VTALARRLAREQRGQVIPLVAVMLVVILGMAALAIDLGAGYFTKQQAQAAADAAALAAVQDLPSSPTTATTQAQSYVSKNISGATTAITTPYNSASNEIQVTVTKTSPSFFAGVLGLSPFKVTSTAVASVKWQTTCGTPGSACYAVFAKDTSCTGSPVTFGGGTHITGAINSNGSLNVGGGGSSFGATTYGNGLGCVVKPSGYKQQSNTFTSGPTQQAAITTWPADYSVDFPWCSGSACTGPDGTPSFCTQASTAATWTLQSYSPANLTSGNIYCGVGSGTPGDPSTWNGAMTVNTGGGSITATFVAGTVKLGGGDRLTACGFNTSGYSATTCSSAVPAPSTTNYPLIYAVKSGTAIDDSSGGGTFTGDMFAPNGTITMGGGTNTVSFLEGFDVSVPGGGFTGDGPTYSSGSSSFSATLIQ
jgi:Flp pilus assembly protein TadG